MRTHVLLTDGFQRKTLAAVRALGRAGLNVAVGETTWLAGSFFSRWTRRRVIYPSPMLDESRFVERLLHICEELRPDVLMPMEEETLLAILRHRDRFELVTRIPFASLEKICTARDKLAVHRLARQLGIPVPHLDAPPPVVVKPRVGSGSRGRRYCATLQEVCDAVRDVSAQHGEVITQERLPLGGEAVCVSMLYDAGGSAVASFTHRRLREYPVDGGPSTLRESIRCPEAEAYARKLLDALGWTGVASVEFKRDDRDGHYKLLEINPRFWGSLNLAVKAGVNFPFILYGLAMGHVVPPPSYRVGVRSRWLIPGDMLHLLHTPRRWAVLKEWFSRKSEPVYDDCLEAGDGGPVLGTLASSAALLLRPEFRRFVGKS